MRKNIFRNRNSYSIVVALLLVAVVCNIACKRKTSVGSGLDPSYYTKGDFTLKKGGGDTIYLVSYDGKNGNITIPEEVTIIGEGGGITWQSDLLQSVQIGTKVKKINNSAFGYCKNLKTITIPDNVTEIDRWAFARSGLTSINIGNGVTDIGWLAFVECKDLTTVNIGNGLKHIDNTYGGAMGIFSDCNNLVNINVSAGNSEYASDNGVLMDKYKSSIRLFPDGKTGAYTIPNSVGSVTGIWWGNISELNIPSNVSYISLPFGNTKLVNIFVDPTNTKYASDNGVLCSKAIRTLFTYPEGRTATSYTLSATIDTIANWGFSYCPNLTNITLSNVKVINGYAFSGCTGLTSISLPSSVTSIAVQAFAGCAIATISVDAANTSYSANDGVLFNKTQTILIECPAGKSGDYTIPSSVTSISDYAFTTCYKLTSVTLQATTPPTLASNSGAFSSTSATLQIKVPAGSVAAYKAAPGWSDYSGQIEGY